MVWGADRAPGGKQLLSKESDPRGEGLLLVGDCLRKVHLRGGKTLRRNSRQVLMRGGGLSCGVRQEKKWHIKKDRQIGAPSYKRCEHPNLAPIDMFLERKKSN